MALPMPSSLPLHLLPRTAAGQLVLVAALMFGVALVDFRTGLEIRVYPFYFIPVTLAALMLGRLGGILVALTSALLWLLANLAVGDGYSADWIWIWNTAVQGAAFCFVAELVSRLHAGQIRESELARLDKLTGLINSRGFMEQAPMLMDFCRREGKPITLAYIDLDGFKQVNDTRGHQQGDEVLRAAALAIKSNLRVSDLPGRIGGDEFAVMLPNTSEEGAVEILEKLRAAIEAGMRVLDCAVTASIGAAAYGVPPSRLDDAIRAADGVMFAVKSSGKNRVRVTRVSASG